MTAAEIVQKINDAKIYNPYYLDEAVELGDRLPVVCEQDQDEHRWFVTVTVVYKVGDEYFGVNGVVTLKSEEMDRSDTGEWCQAFEMEAVPSVKYVAKK